MILKGDRQQLGEYLRELADRMGLRDWTINLMHDTPDNPQHAACIEVRYGRKVANISFEEHWAGNDPETLRATCVHELLHCHINQVRHPVDNIQSAIGQTLYATTYDALTDYIEHATDAIATEWARTLPLPVKARKRKRKREKRGTA